MYVFSSFIVFSYVYLNLVHRMENVIPSDLPIKQTQILNSAYDLFMRFGIKRVSVEEICSIAKVSKMTFYKYFKNKNELVKYLWSVMFEYGMNKLSEIEAMDIPFVDKIELLLKLKEETSEKLSHELALEYFFSNTELKEFFNQMYTKSISRFLAFIKTAQANGDVRSEMKAEFFLAATNKLMELVQNNELVNSYDSYKDFVLEVNNFLFYGILPRPDKK